MKGFLIILTFLLVKYIFIVAERINSYKKSNVSHEKKIYNFQNSLAGKNLIKNLNVFKESILEMSAKFEKKSENLKNKKEHERQISEFMKDNKGMEEFAEQIKQAVKEIYHNDVSTLEEIEELENIKLEVREKAKQTGNKSVERKTLLKPTIVVDNMMKLFKHYKNVLPKDEYEQIMGNEKMLMKEILRPDMILNDDYFKKFFFGLNNTLDGSIITTELPTLEFNKTEGSSFLDTSKKTSNYCSPDANECDRRRFPNSCENRIKAEAQHTCGTCWLFAALQSIQLAHCVKTGKVITYSKQEVLDCMPRDCQGGGNFVAVVNYLRRRKRISEERHYPYENRRVSCRSRSRKNVWTGSFAKPPELIRRSNNPSLTKAKWIKLIKELICEHGSVVANMKGDKLQFVTRTAENICQRSGDLDHSVILTGWKKIRGVPVWIMRNSWGPWWGDNSYGYIAIDSKCRRGFESIVEIIIPHYGKWSDAPKKPKKKVETTKEKVKETKTDENVKETKTDENVKETKTDEKVKETKTDEKVKETKTDEKVKETKADEKIKETKTDQNVKETKTDENVKETKTDENVKETKTDEKVKETKTDEKVQEIAKPSEKSVVTPKVEATKTTETVKESETNEKVKEIHLNLGDKKEITCGHQHGLHIHQYFIFKSLKPGEQQKDCSALNIKNQCEGKLKCSIDFPKNTCDPNYPFLAIKYECIAVVAIPSETLAKYKVIVKKETQKENENVKIIRLHLGDTKEISCEQEHRLHIHQFFVVKNLGKEAEEKDCDALDIKNKCEGRLKCSIYFSFNTCDPNYTLLAVKYECLKNAESYDCTRAKSNNPKMKDEDCVIFCRKVAPKCVPITFECMHKVVDSSQCNFYNIIQYKGEEKLFYATGSPKVKFKCSKAIARSPKTMNQKCVQKCSKYLPNCSTIKCLYASITESECKLDAALKPITTGMNKILGYNCENAIAVRDPSETTLCMQHCDYYVTRCDSLECLYNKIPKQFCDLSKVYITKNI